MEPEDLKAVEDQNVTVRIEPALPSTEAGGGGPTPVAVLVPKKVSEPCWPCVLMGVAFVLLGISYVWMEFSNRK